MQMFDNFENKPSNYIPNNMFLPIPEKWIEVNTDTVHKKMKCGKVIGYWWNWGDSISLTIKNQITIHLPFGAITGDVDPEPTTEGYFLGQKYYNLVDLTSWTLTYISEEDGIMVYSWEKDNRLTYPTIGVEDLDVEIPLKEGQQIVVQLFNFRKEKIKDTIFYEQSNVWELTPDESLLLVPGIYYLNIHLDTMEEPEEGEKVSVDLDLTNSYEIEVKGF